MEFYNRTNEIASLKKAIRSEQPSLIVLYGRRRCGKSTLLTHVLDSKDIYYQGDQNAAPIQRKALATEIGRFIKGFEMLNYPTWESLFVNLNNSLPVKVTVALDEFPYMVKSSPELPSVLQKIIDQKINTRFSIAICGSFQQMMQNIVLESSAPLYGRANTILNIKPLQAGWLTKAFPISDSMAIEYYSVLGGVPRYWELFEQTQDLETGIKEIILNRNGILHDEPNRLFLDEMKSATQSFSLLTLIGNGVHRISEIAARLNKPATHLTRPLNDLIEMTYIKRECPFGENARLSKKSIYKISDPFLNFYFRFIIPNYSILEAGKTSFVYQQFEKEKSSYVSSKWEDLARESVPYLSIFGLQWNVALRWWGHDSKGKQLEFDLIAESLDKTSLLFGEVKWSETVNRKNLLNSLKEKANQWIKLNPEYNSKIIHPALWIKNAQSKEEYIITPDRVMEAFKY